MLRRSWFGMTFLQSKGTRSFITFVWEFLVTLQSSHVLYFSCSTENYVTVWLLVTHDFFRLSCMNLSNKPYYFLSEVQVRFPFSVLRIKNVFHFDGLPGVKWDCNWTLVFSSRVLPDRQMKRIPGGLWLGEESLCKYSETKNSLHYRVRLFIF